MSVEENSNPSDPMRNTVRQPAESKPTDALDALIGAAEVLGKVVTELDRRTSKLEGKIEADAKWTEIQIEDLQDRLNAIDAGEQSTRSDTENINGSTCGSTGDGLTLDERLARAQALQHARDAAFPFASDAPAVEYAVPPAELPAVDDITPEMIEAGVKALLRHEGFKVERIAHVVYRAMRDAR